jgi:hypothetical protein
LRDRAYRERKKARDEMRDETPPRDEIRDEIPRERCEIPAARDEMLGGALDGPGHLRVHLLDASQGNIDPLADIRPIRALLDLG